MTTLMKEKYRRQDSNSPRSLASQLIW